jgi:hypothetical protein
VNLVTARGVFGPGTGPLGSAANDYPGRVAVQISDHAAASAATQGPPATQGMRGAARREPHSAPLSPSNDGTTRRSGSPTCTPPPACQ